MLQHFYPTELDFSDFIPLKLCFVVCSSILNSAPRGRNKCSIQWKIPCWPLSSASYSYVLASFRSGRHVVLCWLVECTMIWPPRGTVLTGGMHEDFGLIQRSNNHDLLHLIVSSYGQIEEDVYHYTCKHLQCTVHACMYLGSVITDEGSKPQIFFRIAQTTAALTRLKPVWNDKNISLSSKIQLMRSLVTSIFLYVCESWTLTAKLRRKIQAMEMRCYCKVLHISCKDHVTNEEVRAKIQQAIGPHEDLLTIVKGRKLQRYGHVSRSSGLAKTILQGTLKGGRRRGKQRKRWEDNIREWTGLEFAKSKRAVDNRDKWRKQVAKSPVVPQRPSRLGDWWWW